MKKVTEDALMSYIETLKGQIYCNKIDSVLNLPANFRWYAAKELLTGPENEVAKITGIRKNAPEKYIPAIAKLANDAVRSMSYKIADFGRYQSVHKGTNVLPENVRILHSEGERYSKKYTSVDLYSNYFFSVNEKNIFEYLVKLGKDEKLQKISLFDLPIYRQVISGIPHDFIFNHPLFKKCKFNFDKEQIAVTYEKETYHINNNEVYQEETKNERIIKQVISAFQNRKRQNKKLNYFNNLNLSEIFVKVEDSINAGNCKIGTANFISSYFSKEIAANTPITAQMVWNVRKDDYTKRAILQAAKRN